MNEVGSTTADPDASVIELLVTSGLTASKGEARRAIAEGGAYLNNDRISDPDLVPTDEDLIHGWAVLRRGKRRIAGVRIKGV